MAVIKAYKKENNIEYIHASPDVLNADWLISRRILVDPLFDDESVKEIKEMESHVMEKE